MKKISVLFLLFVFLTGCAPEKTQSLDIKELNRVDESVLKEPVKNEVLDKRPIKTVLMKGLESIVSDEKYQMKTRIGFDVRNENGTPTGGADMYAINSSSISLHEMVDVKNKKMEFFMKTEITSSVPEDDFEQSFYYDNGKMYLGEGNVLPKEIMVQANIKPILVDVEEEALNIDEEIVDFKNSFKPLKGVIEKTSEGQMVRKNLDEKEREKGYTNAIVVKVESNIVKELEKEMQMYLDPSYGILEVKSYIVVFWMDKDDHIKKILAQPSMLVDINGKKYVMKLNIDYTYETKEKNEFTINPEKQGYFLLSDLTK